METFTETVGLSPEKVHSFIEWILTFVVSLFCVVVLKGSYSRWINDDMDASDVLFDVVIAVAVATGVFVVIN